MGGEKIIYLFGPPEDERGRFDPETFAMCLMNEKSMSLYLNSTAVTTSARGETLAHRLINMYDLHGENRGMILLGARIVSDVGDRPGEIRQKQFGEDMAAKAKLKQKYGFDGQKRVTAYPDIVICRPDLSTGNRDLQTPLVQGEKRLELCFGRRRSIVGLLDRMTKHIALT